MHIFPKKNFATELENLGRVDRDFSNQLDPQFKLSGAASQTRDFTIQRKCYKVQSNQQAHAHGVMVQVQKEFLTLQSREIQYCKTHIRRCK
jgi:hypothetical protein